MTQADDQVIRPTDRRYPEFTAIDDDFHDEFLSDRWWETETCWFSWNVPERRMGGWAYCLARPNARLCQGGAWVWDDSAAYSWDLPYHAEYSGLALPDRADRDMRDFTWPTGVHTCMLEPLQRYRVRYDDPGALEVDLIFDAIMPPNPHPVGVPPFLKGTHFDQAGRVRGMMILHGESIPVDCYSVRDRSWGPRPMGRPRAPRGRSPRLGGIGYSFGVAGSGDAWLVYSIPGLPEDRISCGFLLRDGEYGHVLSGVRKLRVDRATGWPVEIDIEAVDDHERSFHVRGEVLSRHWRGNGGDSLVGWAWDDTEGWGEDQTYFTPALRKERQRWG